MRHRASQGYTILEAMLFITISSAMFLLAMISFSGRQQDVEFTQSVRELDSKIQDVINDVTTGYFPNSGSLQCSVSTSQPRPTITVAIIPSGIGTNNDCVFIGKAVQLSPKIGNDTVENQSQIYSYNIVGRRVTASGETPQNLDEAKPITMSPTSDTDPVDVTDKSELKSGLRVIRVATEETTPVDTGVIVFLTRFTRTFSTTEFSEGQTVSSSILPNTTSESTQYTAASIINTITDRNPPVSGDTYINTASSTPIVICLADNSLRRRASITVGGSGQASTRVDFDTYNKAVCGV